MCEVGFENIETAVVKRIGFSESSGSGSEDTLVNEERRQLPNPAAKNQQQASSDVSEYGSSFNEGTLKVYLSAVCLGQHRQRRLTCRNTKRGCWFHNYGCTVRLFDVLYSAHRQCSHCFTAKSIFILFISKKKNVLMFVF